MENVDVEYAQKKGIIVTNTPDGPTRAVAELTLAMTLALLRRIPQADTNMKKGVWEKETGNLLTGKTIGVVGLGRIGKNVAQIFKSLGNPVIGYDPVVDNEWVKKYEVPIVPFNAIFKKADIITLHIPGSRDKKPVVTEEIIASIKPGSFFINISRGDVVDEQALAQALRTKTIAGAAIDVFLQEPYNGPLINLNNVVLTPHIGSYAKESKFRMEIDAVNNLINALSKN
jgi:D-3-phosphoglycerate dehydrogenase